jgi:peptidoglycan/LPS O-acetylase OafA/YrhL
LEHKAYPGTLHGKNSFDLLRLIFASLVLLSHSFELLDGNRGREPLTRVFHTISFGELAVDFFFILSGFLITMSWDKNPKAFDFLKKRILRIYPAFIIAFLISTVVVGAIGAQDPHIYLRDLKPLVLFKDMVFLNLPHASPTFLGLPYPSVNNSLWTIRYEFTCYLLVLGLGVSGAIKMRWPIPLLWIATLLAFFIFRINHGSSSNPGTIQGGAAISLVRLVPIFLSGAVIYTTGVYKLRRPWLIAVATVGLLLGMRNPSTAEVAVATGGAYLMLVIGSIPIKLGFSRKMPDISYGVYLYGWPVQKLVIFSRLAQEPSLIFLISLISTFCFGLLSWHLVEKPALRLKNVDLRLAATT